MSDPDKTEIVDRRRVGQVGRVLLVEPDDRTRAELSGFLSAANFSVVSVAHDDEALERRLVEHSDVVVCRLILDKDMRAAVRGIPLIESIRRQSPQYPCILTVDKFSPIAGEMAREVAVQRLLPMPVDARKLTDEVKKAVTLARLMNARKQAAEAFRTESQTTLDSTSLHWAHLVAPGTRKTFAVEAQVDAKKMRFNPNTISAVVRRMVSTRMPGLDKAWKIVVPATVSDVAFELIHKSEIAPHPERIIVALQADQEFLQHPKIDEGLGVLRRNGFQFMLDGLDGSIEMFMRLARLQPKFLRFDVRVFGRAKAAQERMLTALKEYCKSSNMVVAADNVRTTADVNVVTDYGLDIMQGPFLE